MKSRRDSLSCFFFAMLLPSEEKMGRKSSLQEWKKLGPTDNATRQARESIGRALLHTSDWSQNLVAVGFPQEKIAIPGGTGQVGTILARTFHKDAHEVIVFGRQSPRGPLMQGALRAQRFAGGA